nr:transposase domain-containing protein [Pseudomonas sp. LD120]
MTISLVYLYPKPVDFQKSIDGLAALVETAKVNGQEPYTWLRHVLERLPHASSVKDYEALLPAADATVDRCSTTG